MKGQQPERGRSQGRGVRHERSAAKRASILDGGPSGGYKRQHRLQRGAPLYCVESASFNSATPLLVGLLIGLHKVKVSMSRLGQTLRKNGRRELAMRLVA